MSQQKALNILLSIKTTSTSDANNYWLTIPAGVHTIDDLKHHVIETNDNLMTIDGDRREVCLQLWLDNGLLRDGHTLVADILRDRDHLEVRVASDGQPRNTLTRNAATDGVDSDGAESTDSRTTYTISQCPDSQSFTATVTDGNVSRETVRHHSTTFSPIHPAISPMNEYKQFRSSPMARSSPTNPFLDDMQLPLITDTITTLDDEHVWLKHMIENSDGDCNTSPINIPNIRQLSQSSEQLHRSTISPVVAIGSSHSLDTLNIQSANDVTEDCKLIYNLNKCTLNPNETQTTTVIKVATDDQFMASVDAPEPVGTSTPRLSSNVCSSSTGAIPKVKRCSLVNDSQLTPPDTPLETSVGLNQTFTFGSPQPKHKATPRPPVPPPVPPHYPKHRPLNYDKNVSEWYKDYIKSLGVNHTASIGHILANQSRRDLINSSLNSNSDSNTRTIVNETADDHQTSGQTSNLSVGQASQMPSNVGNATETLINDMESTSSGPPLPTIPDIIETMSVLMESESRTNGGLTFAVIISLPIGHSGIERDNFELQMQSLADRISKAERRVAKQHRELTDIGLEPISAWADYRNLMTDEEISALVAHLFPYPYITAGPTDLLATRNARLMQYLIVKQEITINKEALWYHINAGLIET